MLEEQFDRSDKQLDELTGKMRKTNQRLADLQHEARQLHLTTKNSILVRKTFFLKIKLFFKDPEYVKSRSTRPPARYIY